MMSNEEAFHHHWFLFLRGMPKQNRLQDRHISRNLEASVSEKTDYDGKRVKWTWLKSVFQLDRNSTDREVDCAVRAYILLLFGGMLMPDKSLAMVHTQNLPFYRHHKKEWKVLEHKLTLEVRMLIDICCESQVMYLLNWSKKQKAFEDAENWCAVMPLIHFALVEIFYENWWLLHNGNPILTTQAEREAWLLLFPSSGHPRGSSGSSSSAVGGSSSRRGSRAYGRGRRGRRAAAEVEPKPEAGPQMEEVGVQFDTGLYPLNHGEPCWEAAIDEIAIEHGTSGHVWRGQQSWSYVGGNFENCYLQQFVVLEPQFYVPQQVDLEYMASVMGTTSLSRPLLSTGVGGAGPSMFTTSILMNVEFGEDSDDEESSEVSGGVFDNEDDDNDDGERAAETGVRCPPQQYDDSNSLHRQTLTRRRRGPRN
ncbi:hypothetical protein GQ457_17G014890 [Hibiscus cannabinus]